MKKYDFVRYSQEEGVNGFGIIIDQIPLETSTREKKFLTLMATKNKNKFEYLPEKQLTKMNEAEVIQMFGEIALNETSHSMFIQFIKNNPHFKKYKNLLMKK